MAHVLLPCDLPSWIEVQKLLEQMQNCRAGDKAAQIMAQVHETSSVSLDPDDSGPIRGHPGFERLKIFLSEEKWTGNVLPGIAEWATKLPSLKPINGVHYSLRNEERSFSLERTLVVSLLANAFFSTFPRRKEKTHPTLQDFSMANFFTYLDRESHQKKLRAFLRYFETLEPDPDGTIQFIRKVFRGPSLPGWLCSERPLVPLVIRPQGCIAEAEPWVFRGCSCASSVGGNVFSESTSKESELFFEFPELLTCLCFLENLVEEEALIVEGVRAPNTQEVNFCFLDNMGSHELDDHSLLKHLNKAVAAFTHEPRFVDRRRTPDGEESSEGQRSFENMERVTAIVPDRFMYYESGKKLSDKKPMDKSLSQASSKFSMRTASESSARLEEEYYTADEESESESAQAHSKSLDHRSADSRSSDSRSADSRSADSRSADSRSADSRSGDSGSADAAPDCLQPPSSSAASLRSFGFVLAHSEDEDDEINLNLTQHERLEDFRRRIRRRTRRKLSSRRSSSYSSGTGSSEMEDISEDPEDNVRPVVTIRPACSEPSLVALADTATDIPPWISPEALLSISGQKQLAATCSGGHLKSYSHDGVRPNLPVPFRARFRIKKRVSDDLNDSDKSRSISCTGDKEWLPSRCPVAVSANGDEEDPQLRVLVLWLAASMAQLPALILYTMNEPSLREVMPVYNQVLHRQWTIGDLACEILRFCRNQTMPGHRAGKHAHLFGQLMASKSIQEQPVPSKKLFTEQSLD